MPIQDESAPTDTRLFSGDRRRDGSATSSIFVHTGNAGAGFSARPSGKEGSRKIRRRTVIPAALLAILAAGCTSVGVSEKDSSSIHSVYVHTSPVTKETYADIAFLDRQTNLGDSVGVAVASAATATMNWASALAVALAAGFAVAAAEIGLSKSKPGKVQIIESLKNNKIEIDRLLDENFKKELQQSGKLRIENSAESADAVIELSVTSFGFMLATGFSNKLYPVISANAEMKGKTGTVLWRESARVTPFNKSNSIGYGPQEYIDDPKKIEDALNRITAICSQEMVSKYYSNDHWNEQRP
jgi:hypothetical protein